jgi:hypothetical protein
MSRFGEWRIARFVRCNEMVLANRAWVDRTSANIISTDCSIPWRLSAPAANGEACIEREIHHRVAESQPVKRTGVEGCLAFRAPVNLIEIFSLS